MGSCCDWASLAQHAGRVKRVLSHEMGAEAVFAQISSFFAHPNSSGCSEWRETVTCETAPSELQLLPARPCQGNPCDRPQRGRNQEGREMNVRGRRWGAVEEA